MDSMDFQKKAIYAMIVIFLMMGVVVIGVTQVLLEDVDEDYTMPHNYSVKATSDGIDLIGSGTSEYLNESKDTFIFQFTTVLEGIDVSSFNVICGNDRIPLESIYSLESAEIIGDVECVWWSYSVNGCTFSFAIDTSMVVHEYHIQGSDLYVIGTIE